MNTLHIFVLVSLCLPCNLCMVFFSSSMGFQFCCSRLLSFLCHVSYYFSYPSYVSNFGCFFTLIFYLLCFEIWVSLIRFCGFCLFFGFLVFVCYIGFLVYACCAKLLFVALGFLFLSRALGLFVYL
jgi:hypothetical protein